MNKIVQRKDIQWLRAALIRALKTVAQTAIGMITVGAAVEDINWLHILSVSAVAGIVSILTSIVTDLPEANSSGSIDLDTLKVDDLKTKDLKTGDYITVKVSNLPEETI